MTLIRCFLTYSTCDLLPCEQNQVVNFSILGRTTQSLWFFSSSSCKEVAFNSKEVPAIISLILNIDWIWSCVIFLELPVSQMCICIMQSFLLKWIIYKCCFQIIINILLLDRNHSYKLTYTQSDSFNWNETNKKKMARSKDKL